jgi:hypothetical protein
VNCEIMSDESIKPALEGTHVALSVRALWWGKDNRIRPAPPVHG